MTTHEAWTEQAGDEERVVLVVDDDAHVRQTIRWALEDEGLVVDTAADGKQALERATRRPPALLVLDLTLPVLNGAAVAGKVREIVGAALPILVISADGGVAQKARSVGAYTYLHKPFDLDVFLAAIQRGLRPIT